MKKRPGEATRGKEKKKKTVQKAQGEREKKLRILILEDNPADAELIERQLKKDGISCACEVVKTKAAYQLALKEFLPDAILADYRLPRFDALQALALRNKTAPLTPFIVITGSVSEEVAVACMKQGADDYLLKDRLARLGEAVGHALAARRLQAEKKSAEESLRASEQLYRTFIDSSIDMAFLKDEAFRHLLANRELCRFYGKPENEVLGRTDFDLMTKKAADKCRQSDRQALAENRIHVSEEAIGERIFETRKFPVKLGRDRIGVGGYIRDITARIQAASRIHESEARYRLISENSGDVIWIMDIAARRFTYVSPSVFKLLGMTPKDVMAQPLAATLTPETFQSLTDNLPGRIRALAAGDESARVWTNEIDHVRKDGSIVPTEAVMTLLTDADGLATEILGVTRDISERRQSQELLRTTTRRLELALKTAKAGTWDWDIASGRIAWSPQMFDLFGLDPRTAGASFDSWRTALHPEDREAAGKRIEQALNLRTFLDSDYRVVLPDGRTRWINAVGEGVYDARGHAVQMIGLCLDITERKQAEEGLREMNEIFGLFLKHNPIYVFIKDENIRPVYLSENYEKMLGRPLDEILGKNMDELFPSELSRTMVEDDKTILRDGQPREFIETFGGRTFSTLKFPIFIQGKAKFLAGYTTDITERRRTEETLQASLHEKEVLLKEIHHRVKNNLQVISGLLALQAGQVDDERLQRMIKESQGRIWTMALIHQTLYQSGNLAAIDMADYIRGLAGNLLSSHAQVAMPPTIRFDLLPVQLVIDKAIPLALILNELVTNSLKHAFPDGRPGEIRITLRASAGRPGSPPVATYNLIVADDGAGLPSGFNPAIQKSLGLQLVAMLAKQLDGSMDFEASGGTSVRVTFSADEKNKRPS